MLEANNMCNLTVNEHKKNSQKIVYEDKFGTTKKT
jgi:hypothetical protein